MSREAYEAGYNQGYYDAGCGNAPYPSYSTWRGSSQQDDERAEREELAVWLESVGDGDNMVIWANPERAARDLHRAASLLRSSAQPSLDVDALNKLTARLIERLRVRRGGEHEVVIREELAHLFGGAPQDVKK